MIGWVITAAVVGVLHLVLVIGLWIRARKIYNALPHVWLVWKLLVPSRLQNWLRKERRLLKRWAHDHGWISLIRVTSTKSVTDRVTLIEYKVDLLDDRILIFFCVGKVPPHDFTDPPFEAPIRGIKLWRTVQDQKTWDSDESEDSGSDDEKEETVLTDPVVLQLIERCRGPKRLPLARDPTATVTDDPHRWSLRLLQLAFPQYFDLKWQEIELTTKMIRKK